MNGTRVKALESMFSPVFITLREGDVFVSKLMRKLLLYIS